MLTLWVHIEGFLSGDLYIPDLLAAFQVYTRPVASYRVRPDNRMLRLNRFPTCNAPSVDTAVHLLNARVHRTQSMQSLLELWRQPVVCFCHVAKQGVTTGRGPIQDVQEGGARGLLLKGDVRVPGDCVGAGRQELRGRLVFGSTVHQVDFWVALGSTRGLMDVMTAEVASEFDGFGDGELREVLVAEGWKTSQSRAVSGIYGSLLELVTYQRPFSAPRTGPVDPCPLCSIGSAARL